MVVTDAKTSKVEIHSSARRFNVYVDGKTVSIPLEQLRRALQIADKRAQHGITVPLDIHAISAFEA